MCWALTSYLQMMLVSDELKCIASQCVRDFPFKIFSSWIKCWVFQLIDLCCVLHHDEVPCKLYLYYWPCVGQMHQGRFQYKNCLSMFTDYHYIDKIVMRLSYLYDGNSYSGKTISLLKWPEVSGLCHTWGSATFSLMITAFMGSKIGCCAMQKALYWY